MNSTFNALVIKKITVIAIVVAVIAFFLLIWLADSFQVGLKTLNRLSLAVTISTVFCGGVTRWWWKYPPLSWWLDVPLLEGTWLGHLESDWTRDVGSVAAPIPIVFVIRQTLLGLSIRSFTSDREGLSISVHILRQAEADLTKVAYIYSLSDEFRAGQGPQQGAAEVSLVRGGFLRFHGEYWTNTKTRGRLILEWKTKELVPCFSDATTRWGFKNWCRFNL